MFGVIRAYLTERSLEKVALPCCGNIGVNAIDSLVTMVFQVVLLERVGVRDHHRPEQFEDA